MIKNIIIPFLIISAFLLVGCKSQKSFVSDNNYGNAPTWAVSFAPDTLSVSQLDSVSAVDNLPQFTKWRTSSFKDQESGKTITFFTLVDPETNIIYTVKKLENKRFVLFKKAVRAE